MPRTARRRRFGGLLLSAAVVAGGLLAGPPLPAAHAAGGIVGMAATPDGGGYWLVGSDGGVFSFGDAGFFGSTGNLRLNRPIVGMAASPTGAGYWLVASDGGIFSFGDARFFGSTGNLRLNRPIVGMASTRTGAGYWLVASDGGIFSFGDARFFGSTGNLRLNRPIVALAPSPTGAGYWLVASDGGIFTFGDAPFEGSAVGAIGAAAVGAVPHPTTPGYAVVAADGSVVNLPRSTPDPPGGPGPGPTGPPNPFAPTAAWNIPLPATPVLDPASSAIAAHLATGVYADLYEYGIPIYNATTTTPTYHVTCSEPWGVCPLTQQPVPIPAGATPSRGTDAAMVVIDATDGLSFEFWQARQVGSGWQASWGAAVPLTGDGTGGATGAGDSLLAGVVRAAEIQSGTINHALTFSSDNTCAVAPRYPAIKTDGPSTASNCIPEGARVRLDPTVNLATIPGITPAELAVGHALQTYGAFARDTGGAPMAIIFEDPAGGTDPYPASGLNWDYSLLTHLPWSHLQVLRSWNGA